MAFAVGGDDASREDRDAPGARRASVEGRRDIRQRDRPAGWRGAVDRTTDPEAARRRRAELAAVGRDDRRGAGSAAFYRGRQETGSPPSHRARLGSGPSRAEAQARHAADPVGRVHRAKPRRISLFEVRSYWVPGWWEEVWAACLQGLYDSRRGRCELATLREDLPIWWYRIWSTSRH